MANKPDHYDGSDIQVLEGLGGHKRPGMYIGSTGLAAAPPGVRGRRQRRRRSARRVLRRKIKVWIHQDNSISVDDNGRGIPIDSTEREDPTVEVVLTILHAGGSSAARATRCPAACTAWASPS